MRKPSLIQLFFAREWPMYAWLGAGSVAATVFWVWACQPSWAALADWHVVLALVLGMVLAPVLGFFVAVLAFVFLVVPIYQFRGALNGAPFKKGDRVQILIGPHRGTVTTVYSTSQGDSVRVVLGQDEENKYKDIFLPTQLLREVSEGDVGGRWPAYRVTLFAGRTMLFVGFVSLAANAGIDSLSGRKWMATIPGTVVMCSLSACFMLGMFVAAIGIFLEEWAGRKNGPPERSRRALLAKIALTIVVCVLVAVILSVLIDQSINKWGH
jgi:hypothetical protein